MALSDYLPVLVMFILATAFVAIAVILGRFISNRGPASPEKLAPYECGIIPEVEPAQRFPVKFYLVAILFVIFDVEIIFLFAWAANFPDLGWFGVATVGVFTLFVLETLVYVWRRGALEWNIPHRSRRVAAA